MAQVTHRTIDDTPYEFTVRPDYDGGEIIRIERLTDGADVTDSMDELIDWDEHEAICEECMEMAREEHEYCAAASKAESRRLRREQF